MAFKDRWIEQAYEKIKLMYPEDDPSDIKEFLSKKFDEDYVDNKCILYNNYEREEVKTSISKLLDWMDERKPILTESGSFFKQHDECYNPDIAILEKKLNERDIKKKEKFKYLKEAENATSSKEREELIYKAKKADLSQSRTKVIVNSEYGVSGLPSSWFFNMACASATTARGQALISTAFNAFEDFICGSVLFMNMDECLMFINNIVKEKHKRKKKDSKWVNDKTTTEVVNRLKEKFYDPEIFDEDMIKRMIKNLSQEDKNRIYYKSNMDEFFRNSKRASNLLRNIVYDNNEFLDPMKPPKFIDGELTKLRSAVLEYVHYNYPTTDRVNRLKHAKRECVIVIDTDSNFINLGQWIEFVKTEICNRVRIGKREKEDGKYVIRSKEKKKMVDQQENFRIANTMINMMSYMIEDVLRLFNEISNIKPDHPGVTHMKNEFLYESILITPAKKHYQGAIRIQEGVYFNKPKFDVKGSLCLVA